MTHLVFCGLIFVAALTGFAVGGLVISEISERKYRRELRRKVRPAHIHIHKTTQVRNYTVQPGALDICFPNTEECV